MLSVWDMGDTWLTTSRLRGLWSCQERDSLYWVGDTGQLLDEVEEFVTGTRLARQARLGHCDHPRHRHRGVHGDAGPGRPGPVAGHARSP